ncbi:MAG: hypothetical protein OIN84_16450 [Candidatus Methanoperedens sp.]|nr:hypothetical protein [Candidatus Methanoperedens sp. BLZ2]KAB2940613.1 MAG: hypothetical protein F9K14_19215 [Candidatus Methanoperedens sp.]MBZ0177201.1 hypothetical protein [Candidatus Methanoperedens nitroreducens]MCX9079556.1 hypothetical protein [Candidatus Methanoperedens sp.]
MPASKSDFEEITLAIGLLGGVIAILLYIGNFFNNNVIPNDADFQQIALSLVSILLIEIPMILLFFLLKCIIILTITFTFGFIQIIFNIKILDYPGILLIYISLLTIILIIVGLFLLDCNIFKSISHVSRGDFWKRKKNPILLFLGFIVIVFTIPLLYYIINMSSLYLLMGSYSIEEFLQPNNENITVGIKETGIITILVRYNMSPSNFIHQIFRQALSQIYNL